jgi:hypothetical protein
MTPIRVTAVLLMVVVLVLARVLHVLFGLCTHVPLASLSVTQGSYVLALLIQ